MFGQTSTWGQPNNQQQQGQQGGQQQAGGLFGSGTGGFGQNTGGKSSDFLGEMSSDKVSDEVRSSLTS